MIRTLEKHGNSRALVLDKAILDLLNITADTLLQIEVSGGSLIITPVGAAIHHDEVKDALNRLRPQFKQMLENLAD